MRQDAAQQVAIAAISHIASDEETILAFLQQAGLSPDMLRERISDPAFLGGILDFILGDDAIATAFCTAEGLTGEDLMRARQALPGAARDYV
jgi:hypothetical protein